MHNSKCRLNKDMQIHWGRFIRRMLPSRLVPAALYQHRHKQDASHYWRSTRSSIWEKNLLLREILSDGTEDIIEMHDCYRQTWVQLFWTQNLKMPMFFCLNMLPVEIWIQKSLNCLYSNLPVDLADQTQIIRGNQATSGCNTVVEEIPFMRAKRLDITRKRNHEKWIVKWILCKHEFCHEIYMQNMQKHPGPHFDDGLKGGWMSSRWEWARSKRAV